MFFFFMDEGFVYLIENTFDGTYKIGYTQGNVEDRRKQLQTGSSQELLIVSEFKSRHFRNLEKYLHRAFSHLHHRGEFFNLSATDVVKFLTTCQKAEENFNVLAEHKNYFVTKPENF